MKKLLIRELEEQISGRKHTVLSITTLDNEFGVDFFDSELSKVLSGSTSFDRVHLVGLRSHCDRVLQWLIEDTEPAKRLSRALPDVNAEIYVIAFDPAGGDFKVSNRIAPAEVVDAERRASLLDVFKRTGGMMEAPRGFHYKKTSGAHSSRLIRTANVLELGENVALISLWVLPYVWDSSLEQVVVDTSGIYAPVLNAVHIRAKLKGDRTPMPVWSHQSFVGLKELDRFDGANTAFVISATTSGTLRERLIQLGASGDRVTTIFSLAPASQGVGDSLCDLLGSPYLDRDGYAPIENLSSVSCPLCRSGSLGVQISGDQFVLEPPRVVEVDILGADILPEQKIQLAELVGTGLLKAYRTRPGRRGGTHDLFVDVGSLFSYLKTTPPGQLSDFWKKFQRHWTTLQARVSTFNLERVVYGSHPYSEDLAHGIARSYTAIGAKAPMVLSQRQLATVQGSPASGTIVVSACIEDAQELTSISRDLRNVQESGTTWYIAPVLRSIANDGIDRLRRVLGFGEFGPNTFSLHHCMLMALPDCANPCSWDIELQIIRELKEWIYSQNEAVPIDLDKREALLMKSVAVGLANQLFWPSPSGKELSLRHDFSLVTSSRAFSQADVYAVMAIALHRLRQGAGADRRLLYTPFSRSVIAPSVFSKFNDGVIQASILRAAREHELHYANCEESTSKAMLETLSNEVQEIKIGRGEATMEFLLAMLSGRLTLHSQHARQFCDEVLAVSPGSSVALAAKFLKSTLS